MTSTLQTRYEQGLFGGRAYAVRPLSLLGRSVTPNKT